MLIARPPRRGFTLAEVLVSVAMVAILAAVVVPTMRSKLQDSYEDAIISEFNNIESAVAAYRQDVGKYPPDIDYLYALRAVSGTLPSDRCNTQLTATARANWRGPYITRPISTSANYIFASRDTVRDSLFTETITTGLGIHLNGADTLTAHNVDVKIDGIANANTGRLLWSTNSSASGTDVTITYVMPMKSGTC